MTAVNDPTAREARKRQELEQRRLAKLRRLRDDFAYWARNLYHIKDKSDKLITLRLNTVQQKLEEIERQELAEHGRVRILNLKARQGGITTYEQARSLHLVWSQRGATALTLADSRDTTDKVFAITQRAIDNFPEEALPAMGERQTREISFTLRDARFYTGTAGAKRSGRGLTLRRVHGSEFAFWDEPRRMLNTVTGGVVQQGGVIVLETTASGFNSEAHQFWQEAEKKLNSYRAVFFPWWDCDPVTYRLPLLARDELGKLEPDERDLVKLKGLSLEQVKWRRWMIRDMGATDFFQEYAEDAESCWVAPGGMFYEVAVLKALMARAPEPEGDPLLEGDLLLYAPKAEGERVIIGCDTAEGGAADRSTWTARSFPTAQLLAEYASSRIQPEALADLLNDWGRKLGGNQPAFLVVEKNMHGITVLRRLRDVHKYPEEQLYHRVSLDKPDPSKKDQLGWATTEQSKPLMLDAGRQLMNAAKDGTGGLLSQACLRDAFAVRRDKYGRINLNGRDVLVSDMLAQLGRQQIPAPLKVW